MLPMDYGQGQLYQDSCPQQLFSRNKKDESWGFSNSKKEIYESKDKNDSSSSSSSIGEASTISDGSSISSSLDTTDDASSSFNSSNSNGSLYDLSDLMSQLPIKRGLSKFYQGKSQSFTSLSRVGSIEELAKKDANRRKINKGCKTYGGGLNNNYKLYTLPKPIISKKVSRGLISPFPNQKGSKFCN